MISIKKSVVPGIIDHAKQGLPYEACGYLASKDNVVVRFFLLKNADRSAEHFSFDPAEQFAVVREIRKSGLEPAAVIHSHPSTPARPSAEDIRLARDPGLSYVIVSLAAAEPVIKSFRINDATVTPEEISLLD